VSLSIFADTEDFLGDVDEDLEAMQSTVYLLQQELKEAKERINKQLVELDELRTNAAVGSQLNGPETNLTLAQHPSNSHADSLVRTDGIVDSKKEVAPLVNNSSREEQDCLDNAVLAARSKYENAADDCSKPFVDSMDIEADSTTGVTAASCRNHSDHNRTKASSDRLLGGSAEDSNGKKVAVDRCRTASAKVKIEAVDSLPNGVAVGHGNAVVE
jgi:molybdopterin converting factor small subunit